jgi:hypothetical protein
MRLVLTIGLVAIVATSCVAPIRVPSGPRPLQSEVNVRLHEHELTVHLSAGGRVDSPLVVYATGDEGWWGKDKELFNIIAGWGYLMAAFSARDYVGHLGPGSDVEQPSQVADDYLAMITEARRALNLVSSVKVILVGKSRGAGIEVAAAVAPLLQSSLQGIVAIGLTKEEEHVKWREPSAPATSPLAMLLTYQVLPQIGTVPLEVIQSTRDGYIPSAAARVLFGPDTRVRRFCGIESADHNFSDALPVMYEELQRSLEWVLHPDDHAGAPTASSCRESTPIRIATPSSDPIVRLAARE